MSTWPIQDAKERFSEFIGVCLVDGPQMVSKYGSEAAVLVATSEWRRLTAASRPSLKQLLLAKQGCSDLLVPTRGHTRRRTPLAAR